jgi:tetratricopeptide (TPR) repeat protein
VLGVALHNLTDFALFEPGVSTTFWAMMACFVATGSRSSRRSLVLPKQAPIVKAITVTAALAITFIYLGYVLVPVATSTAEIKGANQAVSAGRLDNAHILLEEAAQADPLSAAALSLNGRLYLHHFQMAQGKSPDLLLQAVESLRAAIGRNNAAFKDYERLTDAYSALADVAGQQEKSGWLNKAFEAASAAIERYPGCERLHFKLAQIAEQQGNKDTAIEHYKKAIEIEDQYRSQFRLMYPERQKIVSRMGEEVYQFAVERVKNLSGKPDE